MDQRSAHKIGISGIQGRFRLYSNFYTIFFIKGKIGYKIHLNPLTPPPRPLFSRFHTLGEKCQEVDVKWMSTSSSVTTSIRAPRSSEAAEASIERRYTRPLAWVLSETIEIVDPNAQASSEASTNAFHKLKSFKQRRT